LGLPDLGKKNKKNWRPKRRGKKKGRSAPGTILTQQCFQLQEGVGKQVTPLREKVDLMWGKKKQRVVIRNDAGGVVWGPNSVGRKRNQKRSCTN